MKENHAVTNLGQHIIKSLCIVQGAAFYYNQEVVQRLTLSGVQELHGTENLVKLEETTYSLNL